jgi:hypothetical protein
MGICSSSHQTTGETTIGEKCKNQTFATGYSIMAKPDVRFKKIGITKMSRSPVAKVDFFARKDNLIIMDKL